MKAMFNMKHFHEIKFRLLKSEIQDIINYINKKPEEQRELIYRKLSDTTKAYIKMV